MALGCDLFGLLAASWLAAFVIAGRSSGKDWRPATLEPAGIAPDPLLSNEALCIVLHAVKGMQSNDIAAKLGGGGKRVSNTR